MNKKEFQRRMAYEAIIILSALFVLLFVCRLWPLILLVILGIFIATLRLLFLSNKKVECIAPLALPPVTVQAEEDIGDAVYASIMRRITELVCIDYPDARWIWETQNAKERIMNGKLVHILLNKAGGYRRACVIIRNLHVCALGYDECTEDMESDDEDDVLVQIPSHPTTPNYEYLAFTWVDEHILELNERCNEAIAEGEQVLLLDADSLPVCECWDDICRELQQNGIPESMCTDDGIVIQLQPMTCRKE